MSPVEIVNQIHRDQVCIKHKEKAIKDMSKRLLPFQYQYPVGYFDGAAQETICGCGVWLRISPECNYKLHWNGGVETNMKSEIMALWGLMWWASLLDADYIWIMGDSKVLIDHLNHKVKINMDSLSHWLCRIDTLRTFYAGITYKHIYREKNNTADVFSKQGLQDEFGKL